MQAILACSVQWYAGAEMGPARLAWHLDNWARWQRNSGPHLWYPPKAGSGLGRSHGSDTDSMVDAADARCAEAVDAIVDDCSPAERAAVHHKHLAAVYRLRDLAQSYASALRKIKTGLETRGIA